MSKINIDVAEIEKYYRIEDDGSIYSYKRQKYVKYSYSQLGYVYVSLRPVISRNVLLHRVVAAKYLGPCPPGLEVDHIDANKQNNHWNNLQYVTHKYNIKKSFEQGREMPPGNHKSPSVYTKQLMAQAKKRPIIASNGQRWGSVEECAEALKLTRIAIYYHMKRQSKFRDYDFMLSFE